jgi:hypothetical protein
MGLFNDWVGSLSKRKPSQPKCVRNWAVALADGKHFASYKIYQTELGYTALSVDGYRAGNYCDSASENQTGIYVDLKGALHGVMTELSLLCCFVLASKLDSINRGEPWSKRNPQRLLFIEATWINENKGVFLLGEIYFDEERLDVSERFIMDPDTLKLYDPPAFRILADGNGSAPMDGSNH